MILVLYDGAVDAAYWLYVQAYFQRRPGFRLSKAAAKITVRFDRRNILDEAAVRRFAVFRDRALRQRGTIRHDER